MPLLAYSVGGGYISWCVLPHQENSLKPIYDQRINTLKTLSNLCSYTLILTELKYGSSQVFFSYRLLQKIRYSFPVILLVLLNTFVNPSPSNLLSLSTLKL